jgi:ABC-type sugar transport system substrate-binding protein
MLALHARRRPLAAVTLGTSLALVLTACGKSETATTAGGNPDSTAGAQELASGAPGAQGEGCTAEQYGVPAGLNLEDMVVGFSQSEKEANPFRIAETQSIKDEAEKVGVKKLLVTNAQSQLSKQISDIQDLVAQGAQALIVAPLNSTGLEPALAAAREKDVPVITIDRKLTGAEPCTDYLTFIGSNFVEQGERAAAQMIEATGGTGKVAILLGSSGNNVTTDRTDGFMTGIEGSDLEVVAQQTGNFNRQEGQSVTEQFLQSQPDLDAIYAENDEMALGAVVALRSAGKEPGKDVKVVSIDGTRNAVEQVVQGSINGVVESNPRFGPIAFQTLESFLSGEGIAPDLIISDKEYTPENAEAELGSAY